MYPMKRHQRGAVLLVCLMLLLGMTLISIASMNTSTMQERMAANEQNSNKAFQAAESAVRGQINTILGGDQTLLEEAFNAADDLSTVQNVNLNDTSVTVTAQVRHLGTIIAGGVGGTSIDGDLSKTSLDSNRYEVTGIGIVNNVQSQKTIRQGIEKY